jgi:hypothetical protein
MLLEKVVSSLVLTTSNWCSDVASVSTFDHHRSGGVAEDEVAVAVTEVQVTRCRFPG